MTRPAYISNDKWTHQENTNLKRLPEDLKTKARELFESGLGLSSIAVRLNLPRRHIEAIVAGTQLKRSRRQSVVCPDAESSGPSPRRRR